MTSRATDDSQSIGSGSAWQAAAELGCDMELLAESLALSPAERLRLHTIALRRIERLEAAMQRTGRGLSLALPGNAFMMFECAHASQTLTSKTQ